MAELTDAAMDAALERGRMAQGFGAPGCLGDADLSVLGLLSGVFGTKAYMARLADRPNSLVPARAAAEAARPGTVRRAWQAR
jgi:hypothetical protein